jgi:hypothetical protein
MAHRRRLKPSKPEAADHIHQIHVTLLGTEPPVWRRLLVDSSTRLDHFHDILQAAMGWEDYHLHQFIIGSRRNAIYYGVPDPEEFGPPTRDERDKSVGDILLRKGSRMLYEYDFGDCWEHEIKVEDTRATPSSEPLPRCTAGARACPPEDCGGVFGYVELLEALKDPDHERHAELLEWVGGEFDPEAFDLSFVNERLRSRFRRSSRLGP